jgi:hypothetical protein
MLAQLVCVDRRYQRMNCFNIREIQSILKRRFFTDLINTTDHHSLLNETVMGLRFKTNNINSLNPNMFVVYNYGLNISHKNRLTSFNISNKQDYFFFPTNSFFFSNINYFAPNFFLNYFSNFYLNIFANFYFFNYTSFLFNKLFISIYLLGFNFTNIFLNFNFSSLFVSLDEAVNFINNQAGMREMFDVQYLNSLLLQALNFLLVKLSLAILAFFSFLINYNL